MSAIRDRLLAALYWLDWPIGNPAGHGAELDTYRAEVLAEAKLETVAWLVKKASEQDTWNAAVLASKVDRGAVRIFLGTGHYRDAMDTHRAEVLREAGWEPCSPQWLAAHPTECGTAPRVVGDGDTSHWHPTVTRADVLREGADALEARVADVDVDTRTTWAGMDAAYLRHLAEAAAS